MKLKLICALGIISSSVCALGQAPSSRQLIRDVRVFDGERVLEHRSVLIQDGNIQWVHGGDARVPDAQWIEGAGRTLLPGLIDAHVHMPDQMEPAARQALTMGVTTLLDMFSAGDRFTSIKKLQAVKRVDLADILTAGTGATVPGGHPTQMGGASFPTLTAPDQAQAFVDARVAEGSDFIKIVHDDGSTWPWTKKGVPMLDNSTMRALVEAAHKRGKIAVVHVLSEQQARDAIVAGADGLAHLFLGDSVGADFGRLAATHHVFVIATLTTLYLNCGRSPGPQILSDAHLGPLISNEWHGSMSLPKPDPSANHLCIGADGAVRQLVKAGVPLLTGTDAPAPGATYGASVHGEMELFVGDGMTPTQALAAATSVPARSFRLSDRGRISPGMRADLLLVQGDPTTNILDSRNVVAVWKQGVRVQR